MPTPLTWDQVGDKVFQTGVDRGVLYLPDKAIPWNGLTGVDETFNRESQSYYQDGIKYLDHQVLGEYAATLKAFTYPDEFDECVGIQPFGHGLFFYDQRPKTFGLSYRTKIGNDISEDLGYVIHLLYNLYAVPGDTSFSTVDANVAPQEFSWALSSTPEVLSARRPTAHISIKTTDLPFGFIDYLQGVLYGDVEFEPSLPSIPAIIAMFHTLDTGGGGGPS